MTKQKNKTISFYFEMCIFGLYQQSDTIHKYIYLCLKSIVVFIIGFMILEIICKFTSSKYILHFTLKRKVHSLFITLMKLKIC